MLDERRMRQETNDLLALLGAEFDADAYVEELSIADQQLAEIARALNHQSALFVMDEPTASLPRDRAEHLFGVVRRLTERGACVVYISHELEDVFEIADRLTVLKDGQVVTTTDVSDTTRDAVIRAMVGRDLGELFPSRDPQRGHAGQELPALEVCELTLPGHFDAISFEIWPGEIVGMAGLIGSGRTAIARAIFGSPPGIGGSRAVRGTVRVHGHALHIDGPHDAISAGIGYVPEERKADGLALALSLADNIAMPQLPSVSRFGVVQFDKELALAQQQIEALSIRTSSARVPVSNLSGGNQQKVVLGKWLARGSKILILDDPTRGIDVGAKVEIYRLLRQLADGGAAILLISSDLPEVLGLSDRVLVLRKGRLAMHLDHTGVSEEEVIRAALGAEEVQDGQCA
jgi:ABC-type sugar transport system ATPase subunit